MQPRDYVQTTSSIHVYALHDVQISYLFLPRRITFRSSNVKVSVHKYDDEEWDFRIAAVTKLIGWDLDLVPLRRHVEFNRTKASHD